MYEVIFFWYVKVWLSKTVCGISHFWFRFVFIKVYIFFQQKVTHSFASRSLISKLQQEVLKFIDFCVSWSSPKTNLVTNFLNFINVFISLIELKKKHPLKTFTFIYLITNLFLFLTYLFFNWIKDDALKSSIKRKQV